MYTVSSTWLEMLALSLEPGEVLSVGLSSKLDSMTDPE